MNFTLSVPKDFNFWCTVYSHGWCALPPFEVDKQNNHIKRILKLSDDKNILIKINQPSIGKLAISSSTRLTVKNKNEVASQIHSCLRLDENYSEFYDEVKKHKHFHWVLKASAGRLLRAPTAFEDVVKMICTTNCSWALTEVMVNNLCKKLGCKIDDSQWSFPTPEAIANKSEKYLRKEIRTGYRAPYLFELSKRIVKKELDIESWRCSGLPTDELFEEIRSVKGIGPYAAGNILKLLGRYDYLGIDSWCRKQFYKVHRNGRKTSDRVIEKHYEPFGKWKGLFFWMDVTKHWYDKKFPF